MALYRVTSGMSYTVQANSEEEAEAIVDVALNYTDPDYFDGEGFDLSQARLDTVQEMEVNSYTERLRD